MELSIIIPVYNAALTITDLVSSIMTNLAAYELEIILINDASEDNSEAMCEEVANKFGAVKFISLRKNFGEHHAVMCGLNYSKGNYVVIIDDDFQNPPDEIHKLLEEAKKGFDVVYSRYTNKKHSFFRNLVSQINGVSATYLLGKPVNLYLSSFKVICREVVNEIIKYKGPFPYIDGLILRVTRNISTVLVEHQDRRDGSSNYTLSKLLRLYLDMFFNFSVLPLRLFTILGFFVFLIGIVLSFMFVLERIFSPSIPAGWASLIIAILLLSGLQMVFVGLIGEFVGKVYLDQNGTPQWVIKKTSNLK